MPKTNEKNLRKLNRLLQAMDEDSLTRAEFTDQFTRVLNFLKSLKEKNQGEFSNLNKSISDLSNKIKEDNSNDIVKLKGEVSKTHSGLSEELRRIIDEKITSIRDGIDGRDADEDRVSIIASERAIEAIKPMIPTLDDIMSDLENMGKQIRKALKKKQLRILDIKNLRKELDELKKMKGEVIMTGGGSGGGGHIVKAYDLSASLNGVLKTFSLPAFWRVINVHTGGSIPPTMRPTVDYTTDASAMTITFTSEINAATTLASGQTIIVTYSE